MAIEDFFYQESVPHHAEAAVCYNNLNCPSITSYLKSFMVGVSVEGKTALFVGSWFKDGLHSFPFQHAVIQLIFQKYETFLSLGR